MLYDAPRGTTPLAITGICCHDAPSFDPKRVPAAALEAMCISCGMNGSGNDS